MARARCGEPGPAAGAGDGRMRRGPGWDTARDDADHHAAGRDPVEQGRVGAHPAGGEERDVLQRVEARLDGICDGPGPVGVRGSRQARAVGLIDHGPKGARSYWDSCGWLPGVRLPPLTMILTTSQPRPARSATAARKAAAPSASPPRK
jgi:hypothetical protein